ERGGNVEGAVAGKVVTTKNDVKILGHLNVPGRVAASASLLYAKNLFAFLETMVDKEKKTLAIDMNDELVKATMLTHDGRIVHPAFADAGKGAAGTAAAPKKAPAKKPAVKKPAAKKPAPKKPATGAAGAKSPAKTPAAARSGGEA
ncbi:alanine dehydrogenase/PNT-like protein, partial [Nitratireductor pacificus pht-3B]